MRIDRWGNNTVHKTRSVLDGKAIDQLGEIIIVTMVRDSNDSLMGGKSGQIPIGLRVQEYHVWETKGEE